MRMRMRNACWIPKSINTHSEYVILTEFPPHQWLHERASMLPYTTLPLLFRNEKRIKKTSRALGFGHLNPLYQTQIYCCRYSRIT
jgi:hypothetical protein